ncbi:(-)-delta-cadinene synthase [Streptomyces sp. NPDC003691]
MTADARILDDSAIWDVPARRGPHADAADAQTLRWAAAAGLCETEAERRALTLIRPGLLAAWCHPRAGRADSELVAMWLAWLFLLDDRIDESDLGRDADRLDDYLGELLGIAAGRPAVSPMGRALAEIVERASCGMTDSWHLRFRRHIAGYLSACVWQAAHRQGAQVPSPAAFPARRREFGAIMPTFDLVERTEARPLPPYLYCSRPYQDLLITAADLVCWTNDLLTVDKEAARGDPHNLVLVAAHHRGLGRHTAATAVANACEERLRTHERARHELAALLHTLGVPPAVRRDTERCTGALLVWARGHLEWGLGTPRYTAGATPTRGATP